MINKNSIRFLQFREAILDTKKLELQHGINLPPIYKAFISVFKPNFAHHKYLIERQDEYISFVDSIYSSEELETYTSDDDELAFESFKELEDVLTFERSNAEHLENLLFIANHGYSGGLLVGIGKENEDKIYHNTDSTVVTFMANNIFELISQMRLVQDDFETAPIDTSKLYRNWGEDFWRVKSSNL